jgi:F-type H+-transporting ATPase subunit b
MELITPGIGLIFWMLLSFSIVLFVLKKYAWKPILKGLKSRQTSIEDALRSAEKTKEEMAKLKADNEKIIDEARLQKDLLIKEARELKEQLIKDAKVKAGEEAQKIVDGAKLSIESEKIAAINDMRNAIANLSVEIAQKILHLKLSDDQNQKALIDESVKNLKLN